MLAAGGSGPKRAASADRLCSGLLRQTAMPALKKDTVSVACPQCGHRQTEPRSGYSTLCRKCHAHFRLDEARRPAAKPAAAAIAQRRIKCFDCGTELEVSKAATSTMCKRCSSYVDLTDYHISQTVSKSFRTYGRLVIEEKGYLLNTDALVGEAVVKGRLIGKLRTAGALELHSSASIKGSFMAGKLVLPEGNRFWWPDLLSVGDGDIGGELNANLCATGTVWLRATARLFGNVKAANLVVEPGAVFVGSAQIGRSG